MFQIFLGYLFVFFHVKINGIDLLANFIGYALIYAGLCQLLLLGDNAPFKKAKPLAILMIAADLLGIALVVLGARSVLWIMFNTLFTAVSLYLMLCIDKGICQLEQKHGWPMNGAKLLRLWAVQAALNVGAILLSFIPVEAMAVMSSLLTVGVLIANIVFLVWLYGANKVIEANR